MSITGYNMATFLLQKKYRVNLRKTTSECIDIVAFM